MKINNVFILNAGYGTRMGAIGKHLPKSLWPVFEKSIIELQIMRAKEFGAKNIFVNVHNASTLMKGALDGLSDECVEVLFEKELLGVGGGIQNVAKSKRLKNEKLLMVMAGDQFLCFENKVLEEAISSAEKGVASLMAINVDSGRGYNALNVEGGRLKNISQRSSGNDSYITYSGMSVINLEKLIPTNGFSNFFDTVADYNSREISVINAGNYEYWDFGTESRYYQSMFTFLSNICSGQDGLFADFCLRSGAFDRDKLNKDILSYGTTVASNTINLSDNPCCEQEHKDSIILSGGEQENQGPGIYYNNLFVSKDRFQ